MGNEYDIENIYKQNGRYCTEQVNFYSTTIQRMLFTSNLAVGGATLAFLGVLVSSSQELYVSCFKAPMIFFAIGAFSAFLVHVYEYFRFYHYASLNEKSYKKLLDGEIDNKQYMGTIFEKSRINFFMLIFFQFVSFASLMYGMYRLYIVLSYLIMQPV